MLDLVVEIIAPYGLVVSVAGIGPLQCETAVGQQHEAVRVGTEPEVGQDGLQVADGRVVVHRQKLLDVD